MRLLHCQPSSSDESIQISLEEPSPTPHYAILSHRWRDDELSVGDLSKVGFKLKKGYAKVEGCCRQAVRDGYRYVWIDTCCIDKSSSAELSEAINSMYAWYHDSKVCYVYLDDVMSTEDPTNRNSGFSRSEWFTRGWTLQELLAPKNVVFFAQDWVEIGSKASLADAVQLVTKVPINSLLHNHNRRDNPSVARRMSWAAKRKTSRIEDRAYSLMGLFGIHMPIIYGEGAKAFKRLQEEIFKVSSDQTIFAWYAPDAHGQLDQGGLLASSPDQFADSSDYTPVSLGEFYKKFGLLGHSVVGKVAIRPDYEMTNFGVRLQLPLEETERNGIYRAYLACEHGEHKNLVSISLTRRQGFLPGHFIRTGYFSLGSDWDKTVAMPSCTVQDIYVGSTTQFRQHARSSYSYLLLVKIKNSDPQRFKRRVWYGPYRWGDDEKQQRQTDLSLRLFPGSLHDSHDAIVFTDVLSSRYIVLVLGRNTGGETWSDIIILEDAESVELLRSDLQSFGRKAVLREEIESKTLDWVKKSLGTDDGRSVFMTIRPIDNNTSAVNISI